MPLLDLTWYCNFGNGSSTGYYAVTVRPQNTAVAAGVVRRQFTAPAVGSERCFVCIIAGTTANVTDATWTTTRGAKTTDGTVTWQECTGQPAMNGDSTNTPDWATYKAFTSSAVLGQIIKRNSGASYQICTTAGTTTSSEPAFSNTAGVTTTDGTAIWTSLGAVGNFSGGAAPHARLATPLGPGFAVGSGITVYVGHNHAESQSTAMTIALPTSVAFQNRVLCHNSAGSYPPAAGDLTTGAVIATTAAVNLTISGNGATHFYGLTFQAGNGASSGTAHINLGAAQSGFLFDNCSLQTLNTATGSKIFLGGVGTANFVLLNNTTVKFGHTGHCFDYGSAGQYVWQNTPSALAAGSAVPANLFWWNSIFSAIKLTVEAVDLSACSGNILAYQNPIMGDFVFKDCKLHASAVPVGTVGRVVNIDNFIRCDSAAAGAYKSSRYALEGTETTETSITRVGGAQDPSGQAQSRKIVTTAAGNLSWAFPYKAEPYAIWNPTTGANVTVTVCGTINAASLPNDDEIWIEVWYLGDASSPQGSMKSTNKASALATAAAVSSDGSSWNGGGSGAGWSPFKLTTTLSSPQPALAGELEVRVRAAKPSTTYYIDPKVTLA